MNAIGYLAILFIIFAVISFSDGNYDNTVIHLEIAAVLSVISFFVQKEDTRSKEFLVWVIENLDTIKNGTAMYKGIHITPQTQVTQFQTCISLIFFTTKSPSRFFINGQGNHIIAGLVFTVFTLLLGWWGIPWGPVYTIQTVIKNLTGGHKQIIGEMVKTIETAVLAEEKQFDEHASPA
ncbi:MAG: hypothetical protein K0A89_11290 [ANME-2 cluster archaeon]|nr:hypothetical protein [ANME-2 cluster archaeon]